MSEKQFVLKFDSQENEYFIRDNFEEEEELGSYTLKWGVRKLNEQQATIINLQGDVNRLNYIIEELKKDNYKRFEKINELKAKLKEKEEDEKLYAQEILELNKTKKEILNFKQLGGDY